MASPTPSPSSLDDDTRYRALCSHDARFDGRFFVAVTSTGIYCRPVCRVRTPRRENCRFFQHAAQAEHAGFRPCLRCRPELAPLDRHWSSVDASAILMRQALQLLDNPHHWSSALDTGSPTGGLVQALATRLGVSDRHLRRLFTAALGVSPLQALLTRKLLAAKQLLSDTRLPVAQVSQASGFASQRRFNAAFQGRYGLNPSQMRRGLGTSGVAGVVGAAGTAEGACTVRLAWRPPLDASALLTFMAARQLPGVEKVDLPSLSLQRSVRLQLGEHTHTGWLAAQFEPEKCRLLLQVSDSLQCMLPQVIWRVRALFDLDADPAAINAVVHPHFPTGDGLRVPGCFDGFELAVRAVLGQQITVAAARTLAMRLLDRFGEPIATPHAGLNRLFPSAQVLAQARPEALGELGIVRQRQAAIQALARAVAAGALDLSDGADPVTTVPALQALPGIGPWTAQYIAMRALRWPDAWPVGDVALHHALGLDHQQGAATRREAAHLARAWQPWRSYATLRAWAGCYAAPISLVDTSTHP